MMNSLPSPRASDPDLVRREGFRLRGGKLTCVMAAALVGIGVVLSVFWALKPAADQRVAHETEDPPVEEQPDVVLVIPGIHQPRTLAANEASVPDDAAVVGIEAGGAYRAYLIQGMSTPSNHVVNDLPGGIPVSVAYCKLRDCVTAYTGARATGERLDLGVYGLSRGRLVLMARGGAYFQERFEPARFAEPADRLPYSSYPFDRTTWGQWRHAHPDTDIYIGDWQPEN